MTHLSTLSEQMQALYERGYTLDLTIDGEKLKATDIAHQEYDPDEVHLDETFRFEGQSNPADMSILYAISLPDGEKGQLVDSYGAYNSADISAFIQKVQKG